MSTRPGTSLFDLKSKIRRNPHAYKNDVLRQINHWESILSLLRISNKANTTRSRTKNLQALIDFLSAIVDKYPSEQRCITLFPADLFNLLDEHHETLNVIIKKCIIKNLVVLQNKSLLNTTKLLSLFFRLLSLNSKILRYLIYSSILKIITVINKKSKHESVNRSLQNYLFNMLKDESEITVKKSLSIIVELYRRSIWKNSKTVNIIASLCLQHKSSQIVRKSLHFMLGHKITLLNEFKEDELKQMENKRLKSQVRDLKYNARRKQKKLLQIAKLEEKKENREMEELLDGVNNNKIDLSAIRSMYDPQTFVEKLFKRLTRNKFLWDIRLLILNLISRCMSTHQLVLFPFYSFIVRYLKVSQKNVTNILAFTAQSIHRLVPPEIVKPLIRHIANEFINQFSCKEAVAVGINGIRLICRRQPHAMERDLLHDLTEYVKYRKDNGVQMSARALIHLYRIENPELLRPKNRGKFHSKEEDVLQFGEERVMKDLPGAALFEQEERLLNTMVYVTKNEAAFLEINDGDIDMDDDMEEDEGLYYRDADDKAVKYHIVCDDVAREAKKEKPLLIRRILTEDDLLRLKELRVKNLMQIWNRKREDVGLREEQESDDEIDADGQVQSTTALAAKKKEMRREARKAGTSKHQKSWHEYGANRGGGSTNKEKRRQKPFTMTKYAMKVIRKGKRSIKLRKMIKTRHRKGMKKQGKRARMRRR